MLTAQHLSGVWAGLSLKMHVSDVSQGSTLGKGCLEELLTIYLEDVSLAIQGCQRRNNGRREHKHDEFQAAVKNPLRPPESVAIWVTRPLSLAVLPLTVLPSRCSSLSPFFPLAVPPSHCSSLSPPFRFYPSYRASFTMGATWQTDGRKPFIESHVPSYIKHSDDGTTALFWREFFREWYKRWPVPEPTPEAIKKEGTREKAIGEERKKQDNVSTFCRPDLLTRAHLKFI